MFEIKTAKRSEIDIAVRWAAKEGWNPGLYDADCYYSGDPEGFLVGFLDTEAIATISAVRYGNTFGFIGFYIVREAYRDRGYGIRIWNAALDRLKGRNIGLDGVVAQQGNYAKSGFKLAYRNIRYEGRTGGKTPHHPQVVELSTLPINVFDAYDQPFFPDIRTSFIRSWINQPESVALGFADGRTLTGYGVIRRCRSGYKIGPLLADDPETAEILFLSLQSRAVARQPLFLDVPEVNGPSVLLAEGKHMKVVFETARMYTGEPPNIPLDRFYGVTSFEVG